MVGSKIKLDPSLDLTQVDGIAVEARTPAKFKAGGIKAKDGRTEFEADGIDEIMLADGRVLYQCVTRPNGCGRTFPTAVAVRSHLKVHAGKATVVRALAQVADLEAQLSETTKRLTSAERMIANRDTKITNLTTDLRQVRSELIALQQAAPTADGSADREAYEQAVKALGQNANAIAAALQALVSDAGRLISQVAPPDPEILDKAAKWDEMSKLLGR